MLKISYADRLGLYPVISVQFTFEMCAAAYNRKKKSLKHFCGSRSFNVINVDTTGKLVRGACYYEQQVCVYLQPFSR